MIERLQAKQGEFGVMLFQSHNWADWEETKKCYELYARFVMPHFAGINRNRQDSYNGPHRRDRPAGKRARKGRGGRIRRLGSQDRTQGDLTG